MGLLVEQVDRLLEEQADQRELERLKQNYVPNARLRALFELEQNREPGLTCAELARRAGFDPINVQRWLGYAPTSPNTKRGKHYPARYLTTIHVDKAGRLVRALGYAPCEIEGL